MQNGNTSMKLGVMVIAGVIAFISSCSNENEVTRNRTLLQERYRSMQEMGYDFDIPVRRNCLTRDELEQIARARAKEDGSIATTIVYEECVD